MRVGDRDRPLGRGGLRVGSHSFGSAPVANLGRRVEGHEWSGAVPAAWEAGARYFDTAPHYGLGLAERRLAAALPEGAIVSTKAGRLLVPRDNPDGVLDDEGFAVPADPRRVRDYSREGVRRSLQSSLERVKMDRVDILFVHDPDDHEQPALDGAFPALEELRSQGAITSYGAGTATDRPRRTATYDYRRAPEEIIERAAKIAAVCEPHGPSLPAAAGQFPVGHPTVATVCLGARSAAQVKRDAAPFDAEIPAALWEEPSAEGLLRDEAPTP